MMRPERIFGKQARTMSLSRKRAEIHVAIMEGLERFDRLVLAGDLPEAKPLDRAMIIRHTIERAGFEIRRAPRRVK